MKTKTNSSTSENLRATSKKISQWGDNSKSMLVIFILIVLAPVFTLKVTEAEFSKTVFLITTIFYTIIMLILLWRVMGKNFFEIPDFYKRNQAYLPLVIILCTSWMSMVCFGAVTSLLNDAGFLSFTPFPQQHNFTQFVDFYFWYGLDFIPELELNKTFHSTVPFDYSGKV